MRGNGSLFPLPFSFATSRRTSVGNGYSHTVMNRSLWNASASHILTRLASRSLTGHAPPMEVHQHYGIEYHLVLTDDSCIRRGCWCADDARILFTQLERGLEGRYSCVFEEGRVLPVKVEQCLRAHPPPDDPYCECPTCVARAPIARWIVKG